MSQYDELKRLAEDAKNWGGEVGEDRWYTAECFKQPYFSVPDAEFIAACEPGNIRALIAENEALRDHLRLRVSAMPRDRLRETFNAAYYGPRELGSDGEQCRAGVLAVIDAAMGKGEQP